MNDSFFEGERNKLQHSNNNTEFIVSDIHPDDALRLWTSGQEAVGPLPTEEQQFDYFTKSENGERLEKQLTPLVDDVFLSLFVGGRNPQRDVAAILWRHIMMGRSGRIRRPFHVAWAMLRRIAQVNPILGMCIRFLIQEFRTLNWTVQARKSEYQKLADITKLLLRFPNPIDTWTTFLDKILIELLTLDAAPVEVWWGKFIPFQIAWEQARLKKLEKALDMITNEKDLDAIEIKKNMQISASRLGMLYDILRNRIPWLLNYSSHYGEDRLLLEKLMEQSAKLEKSLLESSISVWELGQDDIWNEKLKDYTESLPLLQKAGEEDPTRSPLHLPVAFVPIPGDQVECWGDIELGLLDFEFPYRRVLFERVLNKYTHEQLIYLREFNRVDSFYGISPIEAVLLVAYTYLIAHDVQFRYFTRSNIPAGILVVPGATNINQIRQKLREMLVSPERMAVIPAPPQQGGIQWIPLANINREIQFTDILAWYVKLMVLAFGLQTWEIGLESGNVNKRQLRIRPGIMGRMKFLESAINDLFIVKTFKLDPSAIQFYFYGIDVGDFAEEANVVNNLVYKLLSIDEARVRLGLPPLENGLSDYLFAPSGSGVFLMGKIKKFIDEEVDYDIPEKSVGMWTAIAGGMPKGLEAAGGGIFPAGPALLKAKEEAAKLDDEKVNKWLQKFGEKQQGAIKTFAKALAAIEEVPSPLDGLKVAYSLHEDLGRFLKREPKWLEYATLLGQQLNHAYERKLKRDVETFKAGITDLDDVLNSI